MIGILNGCIEEGMMEMCGGEYILFSRGQESRWFMVTCVTGFESYKTGDVSLSVAEEVSRSWVRDVITYPYVSSDFSGFR